MNKCKGCQWYNKPYWSIINPCDSCPRESTNIEIFTRWVDPTIEDYKKEIDRLNNIINELEETLEFEKNDYGEDLDIETHNIDSEFLRGNSWEADYILNKLKELKEDNKC